MKWILNKIILRLFVFLFSLLFLFFLGINPLYAEPDSKEDEINFIRRHTEKVKHTYPEIDKKLMQIEEKLKTGTPVEDCCNDCHVKKNPRAPLYR